MDKETRLALLVLVIAIAAWRFARYMQIGLSRSSRPKNLGVAGGWVPQDSEQKAAVTPTGSPAPVQNSIYSRTVGVLAAMSVWLGINAGLWYCLLELPPFKNLPPIPVGVAGIFANFYVIPLARRVGLRCQQRSR